MLEYIFVQSAPLFVIINIYSVYSIYFGVGHFNFTQEYIYIYISFVRGQRMVFTSHQNSWTHFRFYWQTFAGQ